MATIAEIVSQLDPKLQVGALNGIVDVIFHPEHAEDGTGDPFKQAIYDAYQSWKETDVPPYTYFNDDVYGFFEETVNAPSGLRQRAIDGGYDWLTPGFDTFLIQTRGTFPTQQLFDRTKRPEPKTDAYGFPMAE